MSKPKIYGFCNAGCKWEVPHYTDFVSNQVTWIKQNNSPQVKDLTCGSTYMIKTIKTEFKKMGIIVQLSVKKGDTTKSISKVIPLTLDEFTNECKFRVFDKVKYCYDSGTNTGYIYFDTLEEFIESASNKTINVAITYECNGERKVLIITSSEIGESLGFETFEDWENFNGAAINKLRFNSYQATDYTWYSFNERPDTLAVVDNAYVDSAIETAITDVLGGEY